MLYLCVEINVESRVAVDDIFILSYYVVDNNIVVNIFTKDYDCSIIILLLQVHNSSNIYQNI